MRQLRSLYQLLLLPMLLPLQLATARLRVHNGRLRTARAEGDRGAISIEMALVVIAIVFIAGAILVVIQSLATTVKAKVPTDVPNGVG